MQISTQKEKCHSRSSPREGPWCERVSPQEREGEKEILIEDLLNSRSRVRCVHTHCEVEFEKEPGGWHPHLLDQDSEMWMRHF